MQVYFYCKGKVVHQVSGIRGEVLPAFSVGDGAVLEANFGGKEYDQARPPPRPSTAAPSRAFAHAALAHTLIPPSYP